MARQPAIFGEIAGIQEGHEFFKGTEKRRSFHILNRLETVGGELNAYTTKGARRDSGGNGHVPRRPRGRHYRRLRRR